MKKEIKGLFYGVIYIIITDAGFVSIAIHYEAPVSDYIIMDIFLPIVDFLFLVLVSVYFENPWNKCLVIKLPGTVDDDELPKLK